MLEVSDETKEWLKRKQQLHKVNKKTAEKGGERYQVSLALKDNAATAYRAGYSFEDVQLMIAQRSKPRFFLQSKYQLAAWIKNQRCSDRTSDCGHKEINTKKRTREKGGGRNQAYGEVSKQMMCWLVKQRMQELRVTHSNLTDEARKLFTANGIDSPNEAALLHWLDRWRQRWRVTRRSIQRHTTLSPEERLKRAQSFHEFILAWEQPDHHTYDFVGNRNIVAHVDVNYTKRCATFIPFLTVTTTDAVLKIPPILLHKTNMKIFSKCFVDRMSDETVIE